MDEDEISQKLDNYCYCKYCNITKRQSWFIWVVCLKEICLWQVFLMTCTDFLYYCCLQMGKWVFGTELQFRLMTTLSRIELLLVLHSAWSDPRGMFGVRGGACMSLRGYLWKTHEVFLHNTKKKSGWATVIKWQDITIKNPKAAMCEGEIGRWRK